MVIFMAFSLSGLKQCNMKTKYLKSEVLNVQWLKRLDSVQLHVCGTLPNAIHTF
jgi:hypothetical protein